MVGLVIVFATLLVFPLCGMIGAFGNPASSPSRTGAPADSTDPGPTAAPTGAPGRAVE